MSVINKISAYRYERRKRKQERRLEKYNRRQEELNNIYKNEKQKSDFKSLLSRLKFETYTKRLVAIVTAVGIIDLQLSYILAFIGKDQIAESLSIQVCTTILGTVLVYAIKSYFETKAEKRDELIKAGYISDYGRKSIMSTDIIKNKVQEIISNTGVSEHIDRNEVVPQTEDPADSEPCG